MGFILRVGIICLCVSLTYSIKNSCYDEEGNAVDWFVLYKIPKIRDSSIKHVKDGVAYAWMTSDDKAGWTLSKKAMGDENSIPGRTLSKIFSDPGSILYVLYNDQNPNGKTNSGGGHAKGVVIGSDDGGVWLIHSVPRYVPPPKGKKKYSYPKSGQNNGQSFLCLSIYRKQLDSIGDLLKTNQVNIYDSNIPKELYELYPKLASLIEKKREKREDQISLESDTAGEQHFTAFAKTVKWHKELYTDFVGPELKVNLAVQTWPNARSHQKSSCSRKKFNVENVEETSVGGLKWTTSKDHSKWAVSETKSKPWVCIGDINKDDSQEKRGGGTVCLKDKDLWKAYYNSIVELDSCYRKGKTDQDKIGSSPVDEYAAIWNPQFWKVAANKPSSEGLSRFMGIVGPIGKK